MNFSNHGLIIPDVSFYQDDDTTPQGVDFVKMKAAGAMGVIIKTGQNAWLDPDFKRNWQAAKQAGLARGSYWFYDSRAEPSKQANMWQAALAGDLPELGLWTDLEESYHGPYAGEKFWKEFVLCVSVYFSSVKVQGIYTAAWWWGSQRVLDPVFWGAFPLWVAQYNVSQANVNLPVPWLGSVPVFWQFTASGDGEQYGVESEEIDLSYFNGDANKYQSFFELSGEPPTPPQEVGTMRYVATNLYPNMSLRQGHDTGTAVVKTFPAGYRWEGNEIWTAPEDKWFGTAQVNKVGDVWLKVELINGGAWTGWVAITHLGKEYCKLVDNYPAPVELPARIGLTFDGTTIKWYVAE